MRAKDPFNDLGDNFLRGPYFLAGAYLFGEKISVNIVPLNTVKRGLWLERVTGYLA